VVVGRNIVVTVVEVRDGRVRLGFEAPRGTPIHREEVLDRIMRAEAAHPAGTREDESPFFAECG
jgi:carbon storage regulator